jgi:predicted Zn-dependent protease
MGGTGKKQRVPRPFMIGLGALALAALGFAGWRIFSEFRASRALEKAKVALSKGDISTARQHLAICLKAWPESSETQFLAGQAARRFGDLKTADGFLQEAARLGWVPEAITVERALLRVQRGEMGAVEKDLAEYLAKDPPDAELILEVLAPAYLRDYRLREAEAALGRWLELNPDDARPWLTKAILAERRKDTATALDSYLTVVRLQPDDPVARLNVVRLLAKANRWNDAQPHLEVLEDLRPGHPSVDLYRAMLAQARGDSARAQDLLDGLLAENPNNAAALFQRGKLELDADRPNQALPLLRRAAEKSPFDKEIHFALQRCLNRAGSPEEKRACQKKLDQIEKDQRLLADLIRKIANAPQDPELRREAGVICLRNDQVDEGRRWLIGALRISPGHAATHQILADHYQKTGELQLATAHRARAGSARPVDGTRPER